MLDEDPFGLPPRVAEPESPAGEPQPEPQEVTDHTPQEPAGGPPEHHDQWLPIQAAIDARKEALQQP